MFKIPEHAKRVFKGILFDVYQWQQQMFDGRTETFEALKRGATTFVIPLAGDQVYYVRQEQPGGTPYYGLPGGRVDEGEDVLTSAKRELEEETGLTSDNWELLYSFNGGGKIEYPIYCYIARDCVKNSEQVLDEGGEKIEVLQTSLEDFLTRVVFLPEFQQINLRRFLQAPEADKAMVEDFTRKLLKQ